MFSIERLTAKCHPGLGCRDWVVEVVIKMPAKEWTKYRNKGWLGQLYVIDVSNFVYQFNRNIPAHCPTVGDRDRASKGFKTIRMTYSVRKAEQAEALGLKVRRFNSGEFSHVYGDYVDLMPNERSRPNLTLVG